MGPDIGEPVDINLLDEQQPSGRPGLSAQTLLGGLVALAILILLPLLAQIYDVRNDTSVLQRRLSVAQEALRQLSAPTAEHVVLRADLDATQQRANKLTADLSAISGRRIAWSTALSLIMSEAGADVNVQSLQTDGRALTVRGDASGLDALTAYVNRLRSSGLFSNIVIELVPSQGTPLPLPTSVSLPVPSVVLPTARPTQVLPPPVAPAPVAPAPTAAVPTAAAPTVTVPPASATPYIAPASTFTAQPTYTPLPTYTALPTYTPVPSSTPLPSATATRSPTRTPAINIRLRDIVFSPPVVVAGGVLRVDVTVDNLGNVALVPQDSPLPGYTYAEGESSPAGQPGRWRIGADVTSRAMTNSHRYRWGFGGTLMPGASRHVTGYIRLTTPGTFTYCMGVVQEFVSWRTSCAGALTITVVGAMPTTTATVLASPSPTRTATACADGYEVDNTYMQARVIGANSSLPQQRSLHIAGDTDWVKFAVIPGITYTLRTQDLRGGSDTQIALFGNDGGVLFQIAQNDEDPGNGLTMPPSVGASRIDHRFTTTDTARFGTTFFARINAPNPANFGCDKTYNLRLTSSSVLAPSGTHLVSMINPAPAAAWAVRSDAINIAPEPGAGAVEPALEQRVRFTVILEVKGGGP